MPAPFSPGNFFAHNVLGNRLYDQNAFIESRARVPMWPAISDAAATGSETWVQHVDAYPGFDAVTVTLETTTDGIADYRLFPDLAAGESAPDIEVSGEITCDGEATLGPYFALLYAVLTPGTSWTETTEVEGMAPTTATGTPSEIVTVGRADQVLSGDALAAYLASIITDPMAEGFVVATEWCGRAQVTWDDFDVGGTVSVARSESYSTTPAGYVTRDAAGDVIWSS